MTGSWSGPGGGGCREQWLAEFLYGELGKRSFLLFGTGNTPTFETLLARGWDVVGCDITQELVQHKQKLFGPDKFVHSHQLPQRQFDAVIAVEVFEHLDTPKDVLGNLRALLTDRGVICGTTNFYLGGPIEDINTPGYMSHELHLAYWSREAMTAAGRVLGMEEVDFQLERPGSVYPDEKYGQLWPNKRAFFLCADQADHRRLLAKWTEYPILPINRP